MFKIQDPTYDELVFSATEDYSGNRIAKGWKPLHNFPQQAPQNLTEKTSLAVTRGHEHARTSVIGLLFEIQGASPQGYCREFNIVLQPSYAKLWPRNDTTPTG